VRRHSVGDVVHTTMGEGNPSHLTAARPYRYKGRPGWPDDPATRDDRGEINPPKGGALARAAERKRKLAVFVAARVEGLDIVAAGVRAGVARKTAYRYETDRLEQQLGDRDA
jgi:hypothetical protein